MSAEQRAGIGRRIAAYRRQAGLTAEQLAANIPGLSRSGLAKIEAGLRTVLPVDLLMSIAWALQVPLVALLFPLGEPQTHVTLGEHDLPMTDVYSWALGGYIANESDHEAAGIAHTMTQLARSAGDLVEEIRERWGDGGEHADSEEDRAAFNSERARLQSILGALVQLERALPYPKRREG